MFQQIRAGQQQVHAIVRSIETIVLNVLRCKQLVRLGDVPTITYLTLIFDESTIYLILMSWILSYSPTGYILEVNLEYPHHLHDAHTDLSFCPTRDEAASGRTNYSQLYKKHYVIHYRNLQQYSSRPPSQKFTACCNSRNLHGFAII